MPIYSNSQQYRQAIASFSPQGATELVALEARFLKLYEALKDIPLLELSSDWQLLPLLLSQPAALLKLLARLQDIQASAGQILDQTVQDPFVRQLIDLECFFAVRAEGARHRCPRNGIYVRRTAGFIGRLSGGG